MVVTGGIGAGYALPPFWLIWTGQWRRADLQPRLPISSLEDDQPGIGIRLREGDEEALSDALNAFMHNFAAGRNAVLMIDEAELCHSVMEQIRMLDPTVRKLIQIISPAGARRPRAAASPASSTSGSRSATPEASPMSMSAVISNTGWLRGRRNERSPHCGELRLISACRASRGGSTRSRPGAADRLRQGFDHRPAHRPGGRPGHRAGLSDGDGCSEAHRPDSPRCSPGGGPAFGRRALMVLGKIGEGN